ncbi:hypothetical protein CAAN1_16S03158 [[Candida] anglica]|uniref:Uncharacterized protein n=1 Tax=[Candida] anglica TaxID=148631 RepID=A0ABP0EBB2_9ASCO
MIKQTLRYNTRIRASTIVRVTGKRTRFFGSTVDNVEPSQQTPVEEIFNKVQFGTLSKFIDFSYLEINNNTYDKFDSEKIIQKHSVTTNPRVSDIEQESRQTAPIPGTLVEFIDTTANHNTHIRATFGIVVEESNAKFDESNNKFTVLTIDNQLLKVNAQDITISFPRVFYSQWIKSIIPNERKRLVSILRYFINESIALQNFLEDEFQFDTAFAHHANSNTVMPLLISSMIRSFKLPPWKSQEIESSYFKTCALMMACHMHMSNNPNQWMVPTMLPANRVSNVSLVDGCSNTMPPLKVYLTQSIKNHESIKEVQTRFDKDMTYTEELKNFVKQLQDMQSNESTRKSSEDLTIWFTVWEGSQYIQLINLMKLYVIYPHHELERLLEKILVGPIEVQDISPTSVFKILNEWNVYDPRGEREKASDIVLSANIMGSPILNQLSVSSTNDLNPLESQQISNYSSNQNDKFPHLRRKLLPENILYGLIRDGDPSGTSSLAISMSRTNDHKHWINVHVQDIATRLSPNSRLFESISTNFRSDIQLRGNLNLFNSNYLSKHAFKSKIINNDFISVGDISTNGKKGITDIKDQLSCMTISFLYSPYKNDPFEDMENEIQINFDDISKCQIKIVPSEELERILKGTKSSKFRLFKKREDFNSSDFNDIDIHNIRFISNVLKTYNKVRNIHNAALFDSSKPCDLTSLELKGVSDIENESTLSKNLVREVTSFCGDMTSLYCFKNEIPAFTHNQDVIEDDCLKKNEGVEEEVEELNLETMFKKNVPTEKTFEDDSEVIETDTVLIHHNNVLLPAFRANSYFQVLMSRDSHGNIPIIGRVCSNNFLVKRKIEVSPEIIRPLLREGLNSGYVDVINGNNCYESLLNQYQILSHLQSLKSNESMNYMEEVSKFSYLIRNGYPKEPLHWNVLEEEVATLEIMKDFRDLFGSIEKRYWKLKELESKKEQRENHKYTCIVTKIGPQIEDWNLSKALCVEMGLELEILTQSSKIDTIGTIINCNKILYIDSVEGRCVLAE